jgi:hypothetical protein
LRVDLRASPALTLLTAAVHLAAGIILWAALPPPAGACAAGLVILLSVVAIRNHTLLSGSSSLVALELRRNGVVLAVRRGGGEIESQVAARRYVSRWLVVLTMDQAPRGHRTLLIARDMLPAGDFRLLRLWALWDALPARRAAWLSQDA